MHYKNNYWWNNLPCYSINITKKVHVSKSIEAWKDEFFHINRHIDELYGEIVELITKRDDFLKKVSANLDSKIKMLQDMKVFLDTEKSHTYTVSKGKGHASETCSD